MPSASRSGMPRYGPEAGVDCPSSSPCRHLDCGEHWLIPLRPRSRRQVDEKRNMMLEEEEENRRMDLVMEIDRIKALDAYEERERKRQEDRRRGARVISEQIRERERERIEEEELRNIERRHMQAEQERLAREDAERAAEKARQGKLLMEEVMRTNAEQLDRKRVLKDQEREEEQRIAEYIRLRDAREEAAAAEKARLAKEKELEIARLRAQQERAADRQAELDDLRARRYQEENERLYREREKGEALRRVRLNEELQDARERQMMAKLQQMAEMAEAERLEFMRILDNNRDKAREEAEIDALKVRGRASGVRCRGSRWSRPAAHARRRRRGSGASTRRSCWPRSTATTRSGRKSARPTWRRDAACASASGRRSPTSRLSSSANSRSSRPWGCRRSTAPSSPGSRSR